MPLATLGVLLWGIRISARGLVRSVTPQVECYLRPRPASQVIELVIANYGLGSAHNVSLVLEADEEDFNAHDVWLERRKSTVPFSIIEPGGRIDTMFGVGHQLLGAEQSLRPFEAVVQYQWNPFWSKRRRNEKRTFKLDVRQFEVISYEPEKSQIAEVLKQELTKIAAALNSRK